MMRVHIDWQFLSLTTLAENPPGASVEESSELAVPLRTALRTAVFALKLWQALSGQRLSVCYTWRPRSQANKSWQACGRLMSMTDAECNRTLTRKRRFRCLGDTRPVRWQDKQKLKQKTACLNAAHGKDDNVLSTTITAVITTLSISTSSAHGHVHNLSRTFATRLPP